ncbi:iron complex transport system substrate-binding protein [Sulfurivirga caldicuralii]|uniref:Iron complex transport system substrate-binding protein n=1 Tax=Sulfurivirga caldicuralii TaxID=364032 RepID=A0A1N6FK77_9GAMM|nr:cobalamin-binding protein [Sulfurivirga caldicuralii]SIN95672.1 iron complex transport system substrate-binding protein [Sulfurivirga caldicuralii]
MIKRGVKAPLAGLFLWLLCTTAVLGAPPQRIVVLAPHAGELVCAAGGCDRIIAVVDHTDFPAQLKKLPHVGSYAAVNIERLIQLRPDLVVYWSGGLSARVLQKLRMLNLPLLDVSPKRLEDIPQIIRQLGIRLGTQAQAKNVARVLTNQLKALLHTFGRRPPIRVFYEIWEPPLMTIGHGHFIDQAIHLCGGINIYDDVSRPSITVMEESLLARNPQVVLLGGEPTLQQRWLKTWQRKRAFMDVVKRGALFPVPADLTQRPGPRLIAGTAIICHALDLARTRVFK